MKRGLRFGQEMSSILHLTTNKEIRILIVDFVLVNN